MGVFAAAAAINTASVALQRRTGLLTRRLGRGGWYVHLGLVLPAWAVFLALLPGLNRAVRWPLPRSGRRTGGALIAGSAALWLLAYRQLGAARIANGDIFGYADPVEIDAGPFRIARNPVYISYALALTGWGLRRGNGVYLLLAAESYVLLNQIEARVENAALAARTRGRSDHDGEHHATDEGCRGGEHVPGDA